MLQQINYVSPQEKIRNKLNFFFFFRKLKEVNKKQNHESVESKVATIRLLSVADEKAKKKNKSEDMDSKFNQLLNYLHDEAPECRIAAAEELGKTSRDVACTHISHILTTEKDENVINALRAAHKAIRENEKREHSARE